MRVLRTLALILCFVCMTPVIRLTLLGDRLDQHLLERRERLFYRLLLLGSDFAHQHWIGRRLLRAASGLEEATRLGGVALYDPNLVGLALRHGGHVLGHQYRPIAFEGDQLRPGSLLCSHTP